MKMFMTATSERGKPITKSGNDWLKIEVIDEDRQVIFTKTLTAEKTKKWCDTCVMEMPVDIKSSCIVCGRKLFI
jgi:hypothetical protein